MVTVKRLDPKYPRMGYEVQKGLIVDMPNGDGKADIVKNEDGSLTLSENEGKDTVTLKDVHLNQLPPTEVGGLFLSSVVERLKADSLPKDSVL